MLCCLCMSFLHCRSCNLVFFWPPDCFMICVCSLCCFVLFVCCMEGTLSGSHLHFIPVTSRSHRITSLFPIHFAFQILPFLSIESLGNSDCKCNLKFTRINVAPLMGLLDAFRSSGCLLTFSCNPGIDETKSPKVGALLPSGKHAKSYWKRPFRSLIYPEKIVIFHSFLYVYQRVTFWMNCSLWRYNWYNSRVFVFIRWISQLFSVRWSAQKLKLRWCLTLFFL
jgi:hypothetical protein